MMKSASIPACVKYVGMQHNGAAAKRAALPRRAECHVLDRRNPARAKAIACIRGRNDEKLIFLCNENVIYAYSDLALSTSDTLETLA